MTRLRLPICLSSFCRCSHQIPSFPCFYFTLFHCQIPRLKSMTERFLAQSPALTRPTMLLDCSWSTHTIKTFLLAISVQFTEIVLTIIGVLIHMKLNFSRVWIFFRCVFNSLTRLYNLHQCHFWPSGTHENYCYYLQY